jgi:hypothetical protein
MPLSLDFQRGNATVRVYLDSMSNEPAQMTDSERIREKLQSGRKVGNRATIYHSHLDVIAVDAFELMLFSERTYRRDTAEQHQSLALWAHSPSNFRGSH